MQIVKYRTGINLTLLDNCMRYQAKNEIYFGKIQKMFSLFILVSLDIRWKTLEP